MSVPVSVVLHRTACVIKPADWTNGSPYHCSCRLFEDGSCLPVDSRQWKMGETPQTALLLWQIFPKRVWGWSKWRGILYPFLNLPKFATSPFSYSSPVGLVYRLIGAGLWDYCTPLLASCSALQRCHHFSWHDYEVKSELESFRGINDLSSQPKGLITQSQCVWKSRLMLHA